MTSGALQDLSSDFLSTIFTSDVGSEFWGSDEICCVHFPAISKSGEGFNIRQEKLDYHGALTNRNRMKFNHTKQKIMHLYHTLLLIP